MIYLKILNGGSEVKRKNGVMSDGATWQSDVDYEASGGDGRWRGF